MTIIAALSRRGRRIIRPGAVPTPPGTGDLLTLALSLGAVGIWPLADSTGTAFADATGTMPGQWVSGSPLRSQPKLAAIAADPYGFSTALDGANDRGNIPYHVSHAVAAGTVLALLQPRSVATKSIIMARDIAGAAGGMSLEIEAGGQPRAYLRDAGNVVRTLTGSAGDFVAGQAAAYVWSWGAAGLKLYLNSSTPFATNDAVTDGLAGTSDITVGAWHAGGVARYRGLLGWLMWFPTQLSNANVGALVTEAAAANVLWANPDSASVVAGQQVVIDALANDHFQGTQAAATVAIPTQGSLGSYAVLADRTIRYTAGNTAGADTAGRYTVNGGNQAPLTVTVTAPIVPPSTSSGTLRNLGTDPTKYMVLYQRTRGFAQPPPGDASSSTEFWGIRSLQGYMTPYTYLSGDQMTTLSNPSPPPGFFYDHSAQGMINGGQKMADRMISQYNAYSTNKPMVGYANFENHHSANVPTLIDDTEYVRSQDTIWASVDNRSLRTGLRVEHARMRAGVYQACRNRLNSLGYGFMEIADYNTPPRTNQGGDWNSTPSSAATQLEITHYKPHNALCDSHGPQSCQLMVTSPNAEKMLFGTGSGADFETTSTAYANMAGHRIQAWAQAGLETRPGVLVWPIIYVLSGTGTLAGSSHGLRPGMMTTMLTKHWNVGVRRFIFWQWEYMRRFSTGLTATEFDRAHAAMEEAATFFAAKGLNNAVVKALP